MEIGDKRIEILSGPNSHGDYAYIFFWVTDYHPGDSKGEYRIAERAQVFVAPSGFVERHKVAPENVVDLRK